MEIYIIECANYLVPHLRSEFYLIGKENALAEYEDALKEGLSPIMYKTYVAPTGLIMRGEKIK